MYFKALTVELPLNIVKKICDYDNTYKLIMKNIRLGVELLEDSDVEVTFISS